MLVRDTPSHVLLHEGDKLVEPLCAERLEKREHTGSEEDFGQTNLIFVLLLERLRENGGTQLPNIRL